MALNKNITKSNKKEINIFGYKFELVASLIFIPMLATLIFLGVWQLKRLNYKSEIISKVEARYYGDPVPMPEVIKDSSAEEYKKFNLHGRYLHDKEIHVYAGGKVFDGKQGFTLMTPLKLDDGRVVLISRGYVGMNMKDPSTRPEATHEQEVNIVGMLKQGEKKTWVIPENEPQNNLWFYINLPEIARHLQMRIEPYYMVLMSNDLNKLPRPVSPNLQIRNHHLEYAITWFSMAIGLIVIFVSYHRKKWK